MSCRFMAWGPSAGPIPDGEWMASPARRVGPEGCPMPLLDHFHGSLRRRRHWESFHSSWATFIAQRLNRGVLPKNCVAEVHVTLGVQLEADVTAEQEPGQGNGAAGGTATAVWAPS